MVCATHGIAHAWYLWINFWDYFESSNPCNWFYSFSTNIEVSVDYISIAVITKWEHLFQWPFYLSHSSYHNGDVLFSWSFRTLLLTVLFWPTLPSHFSHLPICPTCPLCSCQQSLWMPFIRFQGFSNGLCVNSMQSILQKSDESVSNGGWLESPLRLQQLNLVTAGADVPKSACSLAAAWSCHLSLIFPAVLCPLSRWTAISGNVTSSSRTIMGIMYQCQEWVIQ